MMDWQARPSEPIAESSADPLLLQFFASRGFSSAASIQEFLNFNLKEMKDPSCLTGMDRSVLRLIEAYKNQESVCVYGDFDMDGTPGLALLVRGLRGLGFEKIFHAQADRHRDGYGFHLKLAKALIDQQRVSLFVTVDVGITDVQTVKELQADGVDVIVTDHHQVQTETPPAFAIVNPNQPECSSEMGYLCGTGVAFYVIMALRREMKRQNLLVADFDIKRLLDCFAIGTVADMVPLVRENRILVKHGLKVLEKTEMVGLRLLLSALKLNDKRLSAQDVALRFVPKLNSLTRMESELKPIDLFLVEDPAQAALMVQNLLKNNERRVQLLNESENLLDTMLAQSLARAEDPSAYFFWSENFHKGLVGLLATDLVQKTNKPAFVGAHLPSGVIVGSARAPEKSAMNVFLALQSCSDILNKFGGHPAAAGFEVNPDKAPLVRARLSEYFQAMNFGKSAPAVAHFDAEVDLHQIKHFMQWWDQLEPFGFSFAAPVFKVIDLEVLKVSSMKNQHLKVQFCDSRRQMLEGVWFFPQDMKFFEASKGVRYSLLCEPQWNEFMGQRRVQLLLKDVRPQTS